ncbi:hypothetical protein FOMPIDRAFT_1132148 [Fomitopsis schrenkii]|uniref:Uncharacterized protein n=1 Tax=Fomitopsis schrenkii TaxID=2126942 RepID=S8DSB9_FOMSC|nr:hypothetical protein FOMPIDRAFT_1132148 [Fomitopsis schrenkii]
MKEATQINVQMHVEHFKKELTREVMLMTQDVSRLQRERQGLEQQIADLFAFYSKQKQAGAQLFPPAQQRPSHHHSRTQSTGPSGPMPIPVPGAPGVLPSAAMPAQSMPRRPLPTPSPTVTSARPASSFA